MPDEEFKDDDGDIEIHLPEEDDDTIGLGDLGPDEFLDDDVDIEGMHALGLHVVTGDEFVEEEEGY